MTGTSPCKCAPGGGGRRKGHWEEYVQRRTMVDFKAYRRPLVAVSYFKYLGRFLTYLYDY